MPDYQTSGLHQYLDKDIVWPGESAIAVVTFISPEYYPHTLNPGMEIEFYEGHKAVGKVRILRIFNPLLDNREQVWP
jgi:elongation factor Tu